MVLRSGAHTKWECRYHLVWTPKYRKDLFSDESLRECCWELFKKISEEYDCAIAAMEIAPDHVHLLIDIPPRRSVGEVVCVFKSISARELFEKFPGLKRRLWAGELWKDGYFVRSVGSEVTGEVVRKYIENHQERAGNPAQLRLDLKGEAK